MNKRLLTIAMLFLLLCLQSFGYQTKRFVVNGTVTGLKETQVYLVYMIKDVEKKDTVALKNGSFVFKGTVNEPCVAMLYNANHRLQRLFLLDNSEIQINGNIETPAQIKVTGSKRQFEYEKLQEDIQNNRNKAIEASDKSNKARKVGDTVAQKRLKIQFDSLYKNEQTIIKSFIKENPNSYLSANQLFFIVVENNLEECKALYEPFSPTIKQSFYGKEVADRFATLERVKIGKPAMDFIQKDTLGNPVQLSTYKGKYVLLEFWASWCGPCRAEGPNILKAYEKYKDKGLIILAVSLDKDMGQWKKAIKDDHMPWIHVSDLKYSKSEVANLYGVHAIPANFLISPEGKIIAKDLRGKSLNDELFKLFK
jgi:peroxiredoxin